MKHLCAALVMIWFMSVALPQTAPRDGQAHLLPGVWYLYLYGPFRSESACREKAAHWKRDVTKAAEAKHLEIFGSLDPPACVKLEAHPDLSKLPPYPGI